MILLIPFPNFNSAPLQIQHIYTIQSSIFWCTNAPHLLRKIKIVTQGLSQLMFRMQHDVSQSLRFQGKRARCKQYLLVTTILLKTLHLLQIYRALYGVSVSPWFNDDKSLLGAIAVNALKCQRFFLSISKCILHLLYTKLKIYVQYFKHGKMIEFEHNWCFGFTRCPLQPCAWPAMNAYNTVDFEFPIAICTSLPSATTCLERPYLLGLLGGHYIQVLL